MRMILRERSIAMMVSVRTPWRLGSAFNDGMLILRAAAGMDAGFRAERSALDDRGLVGGNRMLIEWRRVQIPVDRSEVLEADRVSALGAVSQSRFLHSSLRHKSGRRRDS